MNISLLMQTTEDVAKAYLSPTSTANAETVRPSVVHPANSENVSSPMQRLQHQFSKLLKGVSNTPEVTGAYNPEIHTIHKRQWSRLKSMTQDVKRTKEPSQFLESFVIVGLHPEADVHTLENSVFGRNEEEPRKTRNMFSNNNQVHAATNLEPQVLFVYPPKKPLPLKYRDLLSFCLPGGVQVHAVERTPSCSDLNEILHGQEQLKESNRSFVFRLQVADDSTLYGCCVLVEEIVQRPSNLVSMLIGEKPSVPSLSRYVITTPRCYCIISRLPFFDLHFGVLQSILIEERLEWLTEGVDMLNLMSHIDSDEEYDKMGVNCSSGSAIKPIDNFSEKPLECELDSDEAVQDKISCLESKQCDPEQDTTNAIQSGSRSPAHEHTEHEQNSKDIVESKHVCSECKKEPDLNYEDVQRKSILDSCEQSYLIAVPDNSAIVIQDFNDNRHDVGTNKRHLLINDTEVLVDGVISGSGSPNSSENSIHEVLVDKQSEVLTSDTILPILRSGLSEVCDSPKSFHDPTSMTTFRSDDFEGDIEEPSSIGYEDVVVVNNILQWAKARKYGSLQIICEYYHLSVPSRGSSLTFHPLEHLPPLKFARPSETILHIAGSSIDIRSCKTSLDFSELSTALLAEEESTALSVWTVACLCGCLRLENVLSLFAAALLEKHIVFVCSNVGTLTASVLSMIPLIRPYQWQSLLIPVLPIDMMDLLDAPVPYVVGVQNKSADVQSRLSSSVVMVDVNKNQVKAASVPQLPQQKELLASLRPYHAVLVGESFLARKRPVHECTDAQVEAAKAFLAVLRSYLDSLCSNLRAHTITNVQSNNDKVSLLLRESFLGSFQHRDRPFMKLFVDTQLFSVHTDLVLSFYQKD